MSDNQIVSGPTLGGMFRRAAEVLREKGHAKGAPFDADGRVCLVTAADTACKEFGVDYGYDALRVLTDEFMASDHYHQTATDNVDWNDEHATQTEVEKFLLACADRADFGGTA